MNKTPKDAELIVGIVARIGVDTKSIVKFISLELKKYNYDVVEIRVTDVLKAFHTKVNLVSTPTDERYKSYIAACNKLRLEINDAVMATLAMVKIKSHRSPGSHEIGIQSRKAYIVSQIKRPEEFEHLRNVYGEQYVQISCHADVEVRIAWLTSKISYDHPNDPKNPLWDLKARELVNMDESQEDETSGQRVREVFPLSDVIIDANSRLNSERGIERFFRALFGDKTVTPTREEYGMELANTAAQRSSDLSRQVGAVILNENMEVKALGCNEVPKANGGTYWEGDDPDGRDFSIGHDSNEFRRRAVILDLMIRLKNLNGLAPHLSSLNEIEKFLFDRDDKVIRDSQLMDSLEYGRTVHAEMNAITDAARVGNAIRNCKLFSNTFPCHNCAKHIVASGISEVIYIHPYPKSYTKELFADSIVINPPQIESKVKTGKVVFRQFVGIVGPMYARVFTKARWKKNKGSVSQFEKSDASYIRRTPIPAYLPTEELLLDELNESLKKHSYINQN